MKKSLIAAAVAGLFVAPAAMAEVTISGAIATGILLGDSTDGQGAVGSGVSRNSLASNYSNINIGSVDDIGNGMKVMFNYQLQVNIQDPTPGANPHNRNSYLGIGGDWGNLKYGTNENVYERMMYSSDFMDGALGPGGNLAIMGTPGFATVFDVGQSGCTAAGAVAGGCTGFYRRSDNTVWYESPNFGGFSFEVDYTLSAGKTDTTDPKILSLGGRWSPEGMPFFIDAAHEVHDDMFGLNLLTGVGDGTSSKDTGTQIGGGMTFGNFQVNARYEMLKYETSGGSAADTEYKRNAYWIGGKMNLPSGYAALQIGIAEEGETNLGKIQDTGATHVGVGYFHNLSKQSQLQFIYNQTDNDNEASYWAAGATNLASPGADHKGLYVGIKHTF